MLESDTNIICKINTKNVTFWYNLETICGNTFLQ